MAEFKLEGFADFEKQLKQLGEAYRSDLVARNTLVKAVKEALVPAYNSAYSKAAFGPPNPYGIHMKETMRIDARIPNSKDKLSYFVNETDAVIGVVSVKKSAVSLANEFGTSKMAAQPFLRSGFESAIQEVLVNLKSELSYLIPAYAKKLQKKGVL